MRPDKPGFWWYGTNDGEAVIQHVIFDSEQKLLCCPQFYTLNALEKAHCFFRWLGPALPPKKVDRYMLETVYSVGMDKCRNGKWVLYDDVEEYLLEDENETE